MEGSICKRKSVADDVPLPPSSFKRGKCDHDCVPACSQVSIATASSIFEQSVLPARFMFYERGDWKDFLQEIFVVLAAAFQARETFVEFNLLGKRYLLSFIRMLQLNLDTGFCRSVAWIDATGRRFTPSKCFEGYGIHLMQLNNNASPCSRRPGLQPHDVESDDRGQHQREAILNSTGIASRVISSESPLDVDTREHSMTNTMSSSPFSEASHENEVSSDTLNTSSTISSCDTDSDVTSSFHTTTVGGSSLQQPRNFPLLQKKLQTLNSTHSEFDEVKKRFLAGLSVLANHTTVTGISKNCHRSTSGHLRYQAFRQHEGLTKGVRGDANVRYAWYSTSKQGVSSVVLHGFGQPKTPKDGAMYGVGIYLAPEKYSNVSAVYSDVDKNGEQHVVLCRVIMGNMEQVRRGSVQFHPSSDDYDCGVDDLCNPRQYIVWSTHMSTHILPEYIVSFKLAAPWPGIVAALRGRQKVGHSVHDECHQRREHGKVQGDKVAPRFSYRPSRSPWMSIDMLFVLLKSNLSAENMNALHQRHLDLKAGRLSSSDFINSVRLIAGDHLVSSSLRSMQTHVLGAVVLQNLLASRRSQMVDNRKVE